MKYFFRRIVMGILWIGHLLTVWRGQKPQAAVLMYHSVSDSGWFFSVSPEEFNRQMRYVKERCTPVRLRDIADFLEGKRSLPRRAVAVTFDDGYRDFETHALPILQRYKIPATVFVTAGEVDRKEIGNYLPLLEWKDICDILRGSALEEVPRKSALVEIGSHALTHRKLTRLSPEEAENEIVSSAVVLERRIRLRPQFFAYPKGSFNDHIMKAAARAGYQGACAATQQLITAGTNRFAIPRIQIDRSTSFFEFKAKLTPAADWYYKLWSIKTKLKRLFLY